MTSAASKGWTVEGIEIIINADRMGWPKPLVVAKERYRAGYVAILGPSPGSDRDIATSGRTGSTSGTQRVTGARSSSC
jgi:hypothetical protein